uniref:Uncharacterized protein n=1 Tax=Opuntia streptacantha TaxID=393608 RepID=A0A7C9E517_OPUST
MHQSWLDTTARCMSTEQGGTSQTSQLLAMVCLKLSAVHPAVKSKCHAHSRVPLISIPCLVTSGASKLSAHMLDLQGSLCKPTSILHKTGYMNKGPNLSPTEMLKQYKTEGQSQ